MFWLSLACYNQPQKLRTENLMSKKLQMAVIRVRLTLQTRSSCEISQFQEPIQKTIEKTFYLGYCLTCFESPLTITARIPVGGYIPGQTIPLKFTADNQSILDVLKFKAQLIKVNQPDNNYSLFL